MSAILVSLIYDQTNQISNAPGRKGNGVPREDTHLEKSYINGLESLQIFGVACKIGAAWYIVLHFPSNHNALGIYTSLNTKDTQRRSQRTRLLSFGTLELWSTVLHA